uniref:Uncharacterized protein n=1 Tax=Arundo donax TaxID=35708 RepID=A0A0A9GHE0_ARUDO
MSQGEHIMDFVISGPKLFLLTCNTRKLDYQHQKKYSKRQ